MERQIPSEKLSEIYNTDQLSSNICIEPDWPSYLGGFSVRIWMFLYKLSPILVSIYTTLRMSVEALSNK